MRDAWRLAVGTLTAIPVAAPRVVDARTAGRAMLLAPVAVLPLGILVGLVGWVGERAGLNLLAVGILAVGALAAGSRAIHWDGLSDTADGLTASYDAERSLAVMKSGTSGPAGVIATVVVAGVQAASLATLFQTPRGATLAGLLVCASRVALSITCLRGVRAARPDGLGQPHSGTVAPLAAVVSWLVTAVLVALVADWAHLEAWRGLLAVVVAGLVVVLLVRRALRRFGGVTGDVYGAAIELALATLLLALT
ncbi:adenosylcobinamide-GDP ribazoletransferase [Marmoricola sp. URHB0036]|uniref:adenosylcobinamide-GDP ribazoletransferase n=1 Tax=Marmoricola sp. URHB0036 TaxID=1298863 RepID=UPI00041D21BC|nr:adenosylcobinamide-GDP ribazoletransferase [Marmoricola sp. URHB0036]